MEYKFFTDQLNRKISVKYPPQKIVSTVPSQTELLYYLGLEKEVIGITKFCIHPSEWFRTKTRIGGTKTLNLSKIKELSPDLIIANKEENTKQQLEELENHFPVWISNIENLNQSLDMINEIGKLTHRSGQATNLIEQIISGFKGVKTLADNPTVLYLIWREPYMAAGNNTFINDILIRVGFNNIASTIEGRYPTLTHEKLKELNPQYVLLSSEPYPFKKTHLEELKQLLPESKIKLVDGELFSWYGSRLLLTPNYLNNLIQNL